jgi:bifunctional ADP-heptose synthase (sugar kinase/adenylyltransferase)
MALAAGATPAEAAALGNLAGAVVVKKIGTTGTATVEELIAKLQPGSC